MEYWIPSKIMLYEFTGNCQKYALSKFLHE